MSDPQQQPEVEDPRLDTLMDWRQQLVDSGAASRQGFKEAHLRLVLRSGRTDVESIRNMLPGSVATHAEDLSRLLTALPPRAPNGQKVPDATGPAPPVTEADLAPTDFAAFEFGEQPATVHPVGLHRRKPAEDGPGGLALSWPPYLAPDGSAPGVVIYRVVSADEAPPYSPDRAHLQAATTDTTSTDDRPPTAAVRHYQVWVNAGPDLTAALAAQPVKHATALIVCPVDDFVVVEDNGCVIGHWTVAPAVSTVFVYRLPAEEAGPERPDHRILADADNRDGFVDTSTTRGRAYRYRVRCATPVDGVLRLSEAVETVVEVSAALAPVTDLSISAEHTDADVTDLAWTAPPAGEVAIYRTPHGPAAGTEGTDLPESALEDIGLGAELRLAQPVSQHADAPAVMAGVSRPSGWSRAYFTPVTLLAGRAMPGTTRSWVRAGTIRDVDLTEYCNKQVLTFDWPTGAALVVVHLAAKGHDPRNGLTGKSFEISREEYEKSGGMRFTEQELPAAGCSLHLVPIAFSGGQRVTGTVRSIEYPGLLRLAYAVHIAADPDGPSHATIALRSQYDLPGSPAFVLVNNPTRIPLSANDGDPVDVAPVGADRQTLGEVSKELRWSALTTDGSRELWAANVRGRQGWIRLFVNSPNPTRLRTIALLDPPVETLYLHPAGAR